MHVHVPCNPIAKTSMQFHTRLSHEVQWRRQKSVSTQHPVQPGRNGDGDDDDDDVDDVGGGGGDDVDDDDDDEDDDDDDDDDDDG